MPPSATASGADASNGSARNREHAQGNQDRKYTEEQKAAVLRIRRCKGTDFYDILGIEAVRKTCSEADIKKAYRKQSLLTHPDKNGHEHADEAFKMVSRAFSVLGDKEKRERYDKFGGDPDSRFNQAQAQNPFAGFAQRQAAGGRGNMGGGMWEDELSPEEMFQRFFGGGGGFGGGAGGPFGGPQFVFNFGGPGVRVHQFGGGRPRRRPRENEQQAPENSLFNTLMGLLPIIFLFLFPLLSSLFSGGGSTPAGPDIVFDAPDAQHTYERITPKLKVKYYVNPVEIKAYTKSQMTRMDSNAEVVLVRHLQHECENEMLHKQRLYDEAQGWFVQDPEKMGIAERFPQPSCARLNKMGIRTTR
ncbi:hypothetical protein KVR01_005733 [Diaporthe batatas]|uniref:uncharacterized protein n=1 Tax=Diaporthe batatas TaxID=748121 RepID=UPI001D04EC66|nr:uncharacterized protein KVR01_005733 [Diaporthe batatas]KAG8163815.1 hypothetical protein KVR01_005733 [Diaporthe batatas]